MIKNDLNIGSIYDYLAYCTENNCRFKLVIVITDKQIIYSTKKSDQDDHWNMIVDINKEIYPERGYDDYNISNDLVIFTSLGDDLEISIPDKVSENQFNAVKDIARQVNHFEYNYDRYLFMPYNPGEMVALCKERMTNDLPKDDDEVIVGIKLLDNKQK